MLESQGDSLGRLLYFANQSVENHQREKLCQQSNIDLSPSQMQVLKILCLRGMRSTELAQRLGITKQAVGQLIHELERQDLVSRVLDPDDARAKLVKYTPKGYQLVAELIDMNLQFEKSLKKKLGKKTFLRFKEVLTVLKEI